MFRRGYFALFATKLAIRTIISCDSAEAFMASGGAKHEKLDVFWQYVSADILAEIGVQYLFKRQFNSHIS